MQEQANKWGWGGFLPEFPQIGPKSCCATFAYTFSPTKSMKTFFVVTSKKRSSFVFCKRWAPSFEVKQRWAPFLSKFSAILPNCSGLLPRFWTIQNFRGYACTPHTTAARDPFFPKVWVESRLRENLYFQAATNTSSVWSAAKRSPTARRWNVTRRFTAATTLVRTVRWRSRPAVSVWSTWRLTRPRSPVTTRSVHVAWACARVSVAKTEGCSLFLV